MGALATMGAVGWLVAGAEPLAHAAVPTAGGEIGLAPPRYERTVSDLEYDVVRGHALVTRQVVGDGERQLVLWGTSTSLHYTVRRADGAVAGPAVATVGAGTGRAASDGTRFLIAWTDPSGTLSTCTVGRDGDRLTPDRPLMVAAIEDLSFDGTNFVAIARTSGLVALRLDRSGGLLDAAPIAVPGTAGLAHARVAVGDGVLMVLATDGAAQASVWAMRLSLDGTPLDPAPVRLSLPRSSHASSAPDVAFGDGRFLAVWADESPVLIDGAYPYDTARRLEGAWLGAATPPVAGAWFAMTEDAAGMGLGHVYGLEYDGSNFAVVTNRGYLVTLAPGATVPVTPTTVAPGRVGSRLDPDLAKQRMRLASPATVVASGYDGDSYLAVFVEADGLWAVRLTPGGTLLDQPPLRLATAAAGATFTPEPVRVHVGGGQFLVTWSTPGAWFGNRVTAAGQVLDGNGFEIAKSAFLRELNVVVLAGNSGWPPAMGPSTGCWRSRLRAIIAASRVTTPARPSVGRRAASCSNRRRTCGHRAATSWSASCARGAAAFPRAPSVPTAPRHVSGTARSRSPSSIPTVSWSRSARCSISRWPTRTRSRSRASSSMAPTTSCSGRGRTRSRATTRCWWQRSPRRAPSSRHHDRLRLGPARPTLRRPRSPGFPVRC